MIKVRSVLSNRRRWVIINLSEEDTHESISISLINKQKSYLKDLEVWT